MRIQIVSEDHTFRIPAPTGWLLYGPGAWYLKKKLGQYQVPGPAAHALLKTARQACRQYRGWKLVEVHSADGDTVEIFL